VTDGAHIPADDADIPMVDPGTSDVPSVQVKSLAVAINASGSDHLVFRARTADGEVFNRPLGGTVEPGERSVDTVVREIREEIDATFVPEASLGVIESIFELDGRLGHEIVFLYVGALAEPGAVPEEGRAFADVDSPGWAEWRSITDPPADVPLYPTVLQGLLDDRLR
jgi:ADP-ribose pyrophosphatase YjhB (NUDIX family)